MMIGDIQSALIRLSKNKKFLKSKGLKSMKVDIDTVETTLFLETKHFVFSAFCEYTELDGTKEWAVNTRISESAWDVVDDYLGDDIGEAWDDQYYFDVTGEDVDAIVEELVDNILASVDEQDMISRFKTLNKIIAEVEAMNCEDRWIIERVAERLS